MIVLLVALFILLGVDAKPISQNHVKFRRLPPKEFSAALGSSITIECEAGGSPPPTIHWLKNGKRIPQSELVDNQLDEAISDEQLEKVALSFTRSRLFIDCADDLDQAVYTCVAENIFSRISSHTKLNLIKPTTPVMTVASENELINGPLDLVGALESAASGQQMGAEKSLSAVPQCLNEKGLRTTEPVRIYMWTHNMVEIMKNNLILFCRSNVRKPLSNKQQLSHNNNNNNNNNNDEETNLPLSNKLIKQTMVEAQLQDNNNNNNQQQQQQEQQRNLEGPVVSWTLPNEKQVGAEHRGKFEILDTGDLLIKNLAWADMGGYVCTVSDEQSSDSISTFVYPAAPNPNSKKIIGLTRNSGNQ